MFYKKRIKRLEEQVKHNKLEIKRLNTFNSRPALVIGKDVFIKNCLSDGPTELINKGKLLELTLHLYSYGDPYVLGKIEYWGWRASVYKDEEIRHIDANSLSHKTN